MKRSLAILSLAIRSPSSTYSETKDARIKPDVLASERIIADEVTQEIFRDFHFNLGQLEQQIEQELERVRATIPDIRETRMTGEQGRN